MGTEEVKDNGNSDSNTIVDSNGSGSSTPSNENEQPDLASFAELISEKDKKLEEQAEEIKQLKKTTAELMLKISAGPNEQVNIDKAILDLDTRRAVR